MTTAQCLYLGTIIIVSLVMHVLGEHFQVLGVVGGGAVVNGTSPLVVLDCHYIIPQGEEAGLVVKWYHGRNPRPVYQWIHGSQPQALGLLRNRLDLRYQPSPDHLKAHSALAFVTPTTELAGEYTCRVATFFEEGSATGNLIIYNPATYLDLKVSEVPNSQVTISCRSGGLYPKPEMVLIRRDPDTDRTITLEPSPVRDWDPATDTHTVGVSVSLPTYELHRPVQFGCRVSIPGTNYTFEEALVYQHGVSSECASAASTSKSAGRMKPFEIVSTNTQLFVAVAVAFLINEVSKSSYYVDCIIT